MQRQQVNSRGEPLKFEGEFDFEQANARFEQEIEKEFSDKLKIGSEKQKHSTNTNDTSLTNSQSLTLQDIQDQQHILMKQKSMNTETLDKPDVQQQQLHNKHIDDEKNFYDKNISFFDKISCESNEKNQSKTKNWKEERKINAETFGLQQRQQNDKSNYNRPYTGSSYNNNYRNNNYQSNNGRNYPRSVNNNQSSQYRSNNNQMSNMNQRYNNNNQRVAAGGNMMRNNNNSGYSNSNNYRRNEMDLSSGQRRFGSR